MLFSAGHLLGILFEKCELNKVDKSETKVVAKIVKYDTNA